MKLLVVGSKSMVGSRFCELATADFNLVKADLHDHVSVDITRVDSLTSSFKNQKFEWLVLFSAFTDVDGAEEQRNDKNGACWQINVEGVKNVVGACLKYQRKLIFISTDFVFDGTGGPYSENDPMGPDLDKISWYGITKKEAEKIITKALSKFIILRISYPYRGRFGKKDDIAKRVLRLYRGNRLYPMFTDQTITPTFIYDLSPALSLLLAENQTGIFHLASPTATTQYDFAKEVLGVFGEDPGRLRKGSQAEFLKSRTQTEKHQSQS